MSNPNTLDDLVKELDDENEVEIDEEIDEETEEPEEGAEETEGTGGPGEEAAPEEPSEELVLSLDGDEAEESKESEIPWVRELRKKNREDKKRIRELERALAEKSAPEAVSAPAPGAKPTMESCNWDADEYAAKLDKWHADNSAYEAQRAEVVRKQQAEQAAWQKTLEGYAAEKAQLLRKLPDFDEAEEAVQAALNTTQQGLILKAPAGERAKIVATLGKSPKKLAELSGITDPVEFVYAIGEIREKMNANKRTPPPVADKPVRARTSGAAVVDQGLDKLRAEAQRTGDYSKYFEAKNKRAK